MLTELLLSFAKNRKAAGEITNISIRSKKKCVWKYKT